MKRIQTLADKFDQKLFDAIYSRSLVYNTCWEDPAVDALRFHPERARELTRQDRVHTYAGFHIADVAA